MALGESFNNWLRTSTLDSKKANLAKLPYNRCTGELAKRQGQKVSPESGDTVAFLGTIRRYNLE
jgi:hypothetical protein